MKLTILFLLCFVCNRANSAFPSLEWSSQGGNLKNTRDVSDKPGLVSAYSLDLSSPTFALDVGTSTSATPAVNQNYVAFPSWDGSISVHDKRTGDRMWK